MVQELIFARYMINNQNKGSKAVVPVLVTHCCFVVCSAGRFVVCLSVCRFVLVFSGPFGVAVASLGGGEEGRGECGGGGVLILVLFVRLFGLCLFGLVGDLGAFRAFVRFVLVWICRFPLPLGVWEGLQFVIVALPGLFSYLFFQTTGARIDICKVYDQQSKQGFPNNWCKN